MKIYARGTLIRWTKDDLVNHILVQQNTPTDIKQFKIEADDILNEWRKKIMRTKTDNLMPGPPESIEWIIEQLAEAIK